MNEDERKKIEERRKRFGGGNNTELDNENGKIEQRRSRFKDIFQSNLRGGNNNKQSIEIGSDIKVLFLYNKHS